MVHLPLGQLGQSRISGPGPWLERVERLTAAPEYAAASAGEVEPQAS
jgi:hypothetical protein